MRQKKSQITSLPRRTHSRHLRPQPEEPMGLAMRLMLEHLRGVAECITDDQDSSPYWRLFPYDMSSSLAVAATLAWIGMAAGNAHRIYRVPASFLIALYIAEGGWGQYVQTFGDTEPSDRYPGEQYFLKQARSLTSRKFRSSLKLAASPIQYAHRLFELGFIEDRDTLLNTCELIVTHSLFECDWLYSDQKTAHLTVEEAANVLTITTDGVRALLESGEIEGGISGLCYQSVRAWEQRRALREIENMGAKLPVAHAEPQVYSAKSKLLAFRFDASQGRDRAGSVLRREEL